MPQTTRKAISKPSLQDYLNKGKTVSQWFAEVAGQDKLDALQKKGYDPRTNKNPFKKTVENVKSSAQQVVNNIKNIDIKDLFKKKKPVVYGAKGAGSSGSFSSYGGGGGGGGGGGAG